MSDEKFVNKVDASGILTVDPRDLRPVSPSISFDIKDHLYMGMIVKEKEFKESIALVDWKQYEGLDVCITCSEDVIVPSWVYMLITSKLSAIAHKIDYKTQDLFDLERWQACIEQTDFTRYKDQKVVVRAHPQIPAEIYVCVTRALMPLVKSLMYGEAGLPKVIFKK